LTAAGSSAFSEITGHWLVALRWLLLVWLEHLN
jgi:hypothetical protein